MFSELPRKGRVTCEQTNIGFSDQIPTVFILIYELAFKSTQHTPAMYSGFQIHNPSFRFTIQVVH